MTNFEFKARVEDFAPVRQVLHERRAHFASVLLQADTYFRAPNGRLKLREMRRDSAMANTAGSSFQLIFYRRANEADVKRSDYSIVPLEHAEELREILAAAFGVHAVIRKRRELFLLGYEGAAADENGIHIRIHLDHVEELGGFVEVEALAGRSVSSAQAEKEAQTLLEQFGILPKDLMTGSYSDLLFEKRALK
ncbi:MAG: class IV adenylate cyclase [bacterium]